MEREQLTVPWCAGKSERSLSFHDLRVGMLIQYTVQISGKVTECSGEIVALEEGKLDFGQKAGNRWDVRVTVVPKGQKVKIRGLISINPEQITAVLTSPSNTQ